MCDSLFTELKLDFFSCVLFVPSSFDPSFQDLETYDGRLGPMAIHGHYITSYRTVELQFYSYHVSGLFKLASFVDPDVLQSRRVLLKSACACTLAYIFISFKYSIYMK